MKIRFEINDAVENNVELMNAVKAISDYDALAAEYGWSDTVDAMAVAGIIDTDNVEDTLTEEFFRTLGDYI